MLAGGPGVRAFILCGGISIEVAQTNLYPAPASRADIMRSIRIPINEPLTRQEAWGADAPFKGLRVHST